MSTDCLVSTASFRRTPPSASRFCPTLMSPDGTEWNGISHRWCTISHRVIGPKTKSGGVFLTSNSPSFGLVWLNSNLYSNKNSIEVGYIVSIATLEHFIISNYKHFNSSTVVLFNTEAGAKKLRSKRKLYWTNCTLPQKHGKNIYSRNSNTLMCFKYYDFIMSNHVCMSNYRKRIWLNLEFCLTINRHLTKYFIQLVYLHFTILIVLRTSI